MAVRLKKTYSSREVAVLTGLSARQLQWWDAHKLLTSTVASRRTDAGGFTERRYSPVELYELLVLADLRRRGFSVHKIRALLKTLKRRFGVRLDDAIRGGGDVTLLTDGREVYARTAKGEFYKPATRAKPAPAGPGRRGGAEGAQLARPRETSQEARREGEGEGEGEGKGKNGAGETPERQG